MVSHCSGLYDVQHPSTVHELSVTEAAAMGQSLEAVLGSQRPPRHPELPSPGSVPTPPRSPAPFRAASPRPDTPGSVGSGSVKHSDVALVSHETLQPAMLRQEIEGGLLLIQALMHLLKRVVAQSADGSAQPIPAAVGSAAQALLLEVCRTIVGMATADVVASERQEGAPRWETALRYVSTWFVNMSTV